jgi:predicted GTPase
LQGKTRPVVVRHPSPWRFSRLAVVRLLPEDLDRQKCTIEEREEFEPHIRNGIIVYAGVD